MNNFSFTNEINKSINCKVYFKPEQEIISLDLTKYYKIKQVYLNLEYKQCLIKLFTANLEPPLLVKLVLNYLEENYHYPDNVIYKEILHLIASVMPDLDEKKYIDDISTYVDSIIHT
jgi:hypothetical protein